MAEFLIEKGYEVHGIIRRSSSFNTGRIAHLYDDPNSHKEGKMVLHYGDLIDGSCLVKIISEVTIFLSKHKVICCIVLSALVLPDKFVSA